jgi:threonine synthase
MKSKYYYQCVNCNKKWDADQFLYLCPTCSTENTKDAPPKGVLFMHYDYANISKELGGDDLQLALWPIDDLNSLPKLHIGHTPLYSFNQIGEESLNFELLIKDDSQNPSYSFKDRASALVSAYAKEHHIDTIITASTGNAGSSLAAICASQNQKAIILLPQSAPAAKLVQVEMYGAQLIKVDGNYDQAFDESIKMSDSNNWFNRNTAYNPLTIEGKKSVSLEVYQELNGEIPDMIFVPVGDGVILSGVYKGFEDLYKMGLIKKLPIIIAVQAEKSANIINNLETTSPEFPPATTKADSISVDIPRNYYMATWFLKKYQGRTTLVSDKEIQQASALMASSFGLFAEPAAAAAFAGFLSCKSQGLIDEGMKVLVLHTGSGLKDIASAQTYLKESK